jgi:hypothetical protein
MNNDNWFDLKEKLINRFGEINETTHKEEREDDVGHRIVTTIETLEFNSPLGKLKIERLSRPKILDKISHYHKGAGVAKVELVLSDDEVSHRLSVYKLDDAGDWQPLDLPAERLTF